MQRDIWLPRVGALALLSVLSMSAHCQNLLVDGGFESPVVPDGSFTDFQVGSKFSNWQVIGTAGNVALISGTYTGCDGSLWLTRSGKQFIDLTGTTNSFTGIQQTVPTEVGKSYTLSFWLGNVFACGGSSTVEVMINGVTAMRASNFANAGAQQVWRFFQLTFAASKSATTVQFLNGSPPANRETGLDEVNLVPAAIE